MAGYTKCVKRPASNYSVNPLVEEAEAFFLPHHSYPFPAFYWLLATLIWTMPDWGCIAEKSPTKGRGLAGPASDVA